MSSSQQPTSTAVPDTQLGLTEDEIQLLRHGQQQVAAAAAAAAAAAGSTSSRAASRASSQGLLMMDSSSLTALGRHFDRVMQHIQERLEHLMLERSVAPRDANAVAQRTVKLVKDKVMPKVDGGTFDLEVDTICLHGDSPTAVEVAREVRRQLAEADIEVAPLSQHKLATTRK